MSEASVLRIDVHVPNESDAFVFTSAALHGSGLSSGEPAWNAAVAAGQLLPFIVESEDPANVRVLVGPLDPAEAEQWVGLVRGRLALLDGRLALCGGVAWVLENDAWTEELARIVTVPAGIYRATVYCYASAPNARLCIEAAGDEEPLGAWFRRTRAGEEMPAWLHNLCVHDPDLDPGLEKAWRRADEKSGPAVVDFLLHLEPAADAAAVELADHGFAEATECRKPARFPLGVPMSGHGLDSAPRENAEAPVVAVPPASPATPADNSLPPITGGTATLPAAKIVRLARLAWLCHPYTRPTLRLTFPEKASRLEDVEEATLKTKGAVVDVHFDDNGQPAGAAHALGALGKQLTSVPDGTTFALELVRKNGGPLGHHRYAAVAEGGVWRLTGAAPVNDAGVLAEALALAAAIENGRTLAARDEDEAARIEARAAHHLADALGSNRLQRSGAEVALKRRDPVLFGHVVSRAFWMRYAEVWPLQDDDLPA